MVLQNSTERMAEVLVISIRDGGRIPPEKLLELSRQGWSVAHAGRQSSDYTGSSDGWYIRLEK